MIIRNATTDDLPVLQSIFDIARQSMRDNGNDVQWVNGYPSRELLERDIANEGLYAVEQDGVVHGAFYFAVEDDPTYFEIDGAWLNDEPYGVIHRVASDGQIRGLMRAAVAFGGERIDNLRVDTHELNTPMRSALKRCGFRECGTIHIADGTPRVAYHLVIDESAS